MYLMYVDESGDTGLQNSPTKYFVLTGLVLHELKWRDFVDDLINIRKELKRSYGIGIREEIHTSEFVNKSHKSSLEKHKRLLLLRDYVTGLSNLDYLSITNIVVDKSDKSAPYDVFDNAWRCLFQRFENTLNYKNFPGPANSQDTGIVFCDDTNGRKLNTLIRKMAVYNPIPSQFTGSYQQRPIKLIIEDPNMRDSKNSLPIQAADACAYMLAQHLQPNAYFRKKTGHGYFKRLKPILNVKASAKDPEYGIVRL